MLTCSTVRSASALLLMQHVLTHVLCCSLSTSSTHDSSLEPLLAMLSDVQDISKVACCLDTLTFLLLDEVRMRRLLHARPMKPGSLLMCLMHRSSQANRREIQSLRGVEALMDVVGRYGIASGNCADVCSTSRPYASVGVAAHGRSAEQAVMVSAANALAALVSQSGEARVGNARPCTAVMNNNRWECVHAEGLTGCACFYSAARRLRSGVMHTLLRYCPFCLQGALLAS